VQQRWDRNNVRTWRSTNISTIATSRTHCPKCQAQAVVQSAAELRPGIDYLTLRCTSCGLVYNAQVLSDPTKGTAMHTVMNVFEGPIVRIRETCDLMGVGPDFERKLPALETYLEGLVADGETNEERLAVSGLTFLKRAP
jgi:transcription elongation factor Elf1